MKSISKPVDALLELPGRDEEKVDPQFVTALARGLEVLRAFEPKDGPLGNQEIAERCGLPKPTVSRITYTLTKLGYLEYVPRLSKYRIGLGVLALGHASVGGAALRRAARPYMQELATHADATVALGGRDRLSMIYLDVCRGRQTATFSLDVGSRIPVYLSAMGFAYLWAIPEKARDFLFDAIRHRLGNDWQTFNTNLESAFKSLDQNGFCVAEATYERAINGVGVPLSLQGGAEVYAISCSAPTFQMSAERLRDEIGPRLVALSAAIKSELEGHAHAY
jgi:DNA-binding IclR family transcriptional regulator